MSEYRLTKWEWIEVVLVGCFMTPFSGFMLFAWIKLTKRG